MDIWKEATGVLVGGKDVNFTNNELYNVNSENEKWESFRLKISCSGNLNYSGNIPEMLDLMLYYPNTRTFENEKFVAVELLEYKPEELPFYLKKDGGKSTFKDCIFTTAFVNHREDVGRCCLNDPSFCSNGTYPATWWEKT